MPRNFTVPTPLPAAMWIIVIPKRPRGELTVLMNNRYSRVSFRERRRRRERIGAPSDIDVANG